MLNTELTHVRVKEDQANEKSKGRLFRACYGKGVIHCHLGFDRDSKASRGVRKLYSEKREGLRCALSGAVGTGKLEVG